MENSYEIQYQEALDSIRAQFLSQEEAAQNTENNGAFNRYHAHGDFEKATNQYNEDLQASHQANVANKLASLSNLKAANLTAIAKINNTDSNSLITAVNAAAVNIDKAVNLIATMAQDTSGVADAINNEDANTKLAKSANTTAAMANNASLHAQETLQNALQANIATSESTSGLVLNDSTTAATDLKAVSTATQKSFDRTLKALSATQEQVIEAQTAELSSDEKFMDAHANTEAFQAALEQILIISNYEMELSATISGSSKPKYGYQDQFMLSFDAFHNDPPIVQEYVAFLLPYNESFGFDIDNAMAIYEDEKDKNYTVFSPRGDSHLEGDVNIGDIEIDVSVEIKDKKKAKSTSPLGGKLNMVDYKGRKITPADNLGQSYVVAVMAVYDNAYFQNYLSITSNQCSLELLIQEADTLTLSFSPDGKYLGKASAKVYSAPSTPAGVETQFRGFLVNEEIDVGTTLDEMIAETLPAGYYVPLKPSGKVNLEDDTVDYYGQPLADGASYFMQVLSVAINTETSETLAVALSKPSDTAEYPNSAASPTLNDNEK